MALRQIAQPFDTYDQLIGIIRQRLAEVGAPCDAVSALSGLPDRYVSKLVNPRRSKILGKISFGLLLQVLGIRLVALVDDAAYAPLKARLKPARFHRWDLEPPSCDLATGREMKLRLDDLGGLQEVAKVMGLRAAVIVPVETVTKPRRRARPLEGLAGAI
jgi:hypothetical protein